MVGCLSREDAKNAKDAKLLFVIFTSASCLFKCFTVQNKTEWVTGTLFSHFFLFLRDASKENLVEKSVPQKQEF